MNIQTIILILTNIVVPIVVAIIQTKKYNKEIELLNITHENRIKELKNEYSHQIETLELQHKHERELESQKSENVILEMMTDKLTGEIIKRPATQKMINQRTTQGFLSKKQR